jgi:tetratricopeptide (TPR) repeat protein
LVQLSAEPLGGRKSEPMKTPRGSQTTALAAVFLAISAAAQVNGDPWRARFEACKTAFGSRDLNAAETRCKEALEAARAESPPGLRTALSLNSLGTVYVEQGRLTEARKPFYQALEIFELEAAGPNEHFIGLLTNVGDLELRESNGERAEAAFRRAAELASQLEPQMPALIARANRGVVASLCQQGKLQEADALGKKFGVSCAQ